jgi:hypothetical protein
MTELPTHLPSKLLFGAVFAVLFGGGLTLFLGWHWIRRLFGIPRIPRPRALYLVLSALWVAFAATACAAIGMIVLLRDHQQVDGRTELGEIRCNASGPARLQAQLLTSPSAAPEQYDLAGDACVVWVKQVQLRPGFAALGLRGLSRIDRIGPLARPAAHPEWLGRRLTDLVVRRTEAVPVTVPAGAQKRLVVVSSPGGPTLEPTSS